MSEVEIRGLVDSINHLEAVRILLVHLNNETNLTMLRHKTILQIMVTACEFLVNSIRIIERDLRIS